MYEYYATTQTPDYIDNWTFNETIYNNYNYGYYNG